VGIKFVGSELLVHDGTQLPTSRKLPGKHPKRHFVVLFQKIFKNEQAKARVRRSFSNAK